MSKDYDLSHFCDLAEHGQCAGSSAGERAAAVLARAAYEQFLLLDGPARRGFVEWLVDVSAAPMSCRELMEEWGYEF